MRVAPGVTRGSPPGFGRGGSPGAAQVGRTPVEIVRSAWPTV